MAQTLNPALPLLHKADELSRQFTSLHLESLNLVAALRNQAAQQHNLLLFLMKRGSSGPRAMALSKLQQQTEEVLAALRHPCLSRMDQLVTEDFRSLLFQTETFLSDPGNSSNPHLSDPRSSLSHISRLYDMYYAEVDRKRELLAELMMHADDDESGVPQNDGSEWLQAVQEFEEEWKGMKEVEQAEEEELGDLVNVLGRWSNHDASQDAAMEQ